MKAYLASIIFLVFALVISFIFMLYNSPGGLSIIDENRGTSLFDVNAFKTEGRICALKIKYYNPQSNICLTNTQCSKLNYKIFSEQHVCG